MMVRYWEDLAEGEPLDCRRIILEQAEIIEFARQFDPQLFHIDPDFAVASRFKGIIASSLHTFSATTRVIVDAQKNVAILIGLGILEVALPSVVRPGDLLAVDAYWSDLRQSASKPWQGVATVRFTVRNQHKETVLESGYKYMIACRPACQHSR